MTLKPASAIGLPLVIDTAGRADTADGSNAFAIETQVLALFDSSADSLLRYIGSFGLTVEETEDIVQESFLALFHHLRLGRPQTNLKGWLFKVAHNLALRQRRRQRRHGHLSGAGQVDLHVDPTPNPEARLAIAERSRRLRSVVLALPERDRQCLFLRSEGLRYRDIAQALGISLGGVAKSLARSMARLVNADRR